MQDVRRAVWLLWVPLAVACGGGGAAAPDDAGTVGEVSADIAAVDAGADAELDGGPGASEVEIFGQGDGASGAGAGGSGGGGPVAGESLQLNEVQCARAGAWVELVNLDPVLGAWLDGLVIRSGDLQHAVADTTWIDPGGVALVTLPAAVAELTCGGLVELVDGGAVMDAVAGDGRDRDSSGRLPDGAEEWGSRAPTPGAANAPSLFDTARVHGIAVTLDGGSVGVRDDGFGELAEVGAAIAVTGDTGSEGGKPRFDVVFEAPLKGVTAVVLDPLVGDAGGLRAMMWAELARRFGVVAPRVGYARVTVEGEEYGLYSVVEELTDEAAVAATWPAGGSVTLHDGEAVPADVGAALEVEGLHRAWAVAAFAGRTTLGAHMVHLDADGVGRIGLLATTGGVADAWAEARDYREIGGALFGACQADEACRVAYQKTLGELTVALAGPELLEVGATSFAAHVEQALEDAQAGYGVADVYASGTATLSWIEARRRSLLHTHSCLVEGEPDGDDDGFMCSDDCDDGRADVHAGLVDVCGDGVDQDCNGWIDDGPGCADCEEMWRGGRRYLYCPKPRTAAAAAARCAEQGAQLAVLTAGGEARWVREQVASLGAGDVGLWIDGGQPEVDGDPPPCAVLASDASWAGAGCGGERPSVCEEACDPATDADGDGFDACGADCDDLAADVNPEGSDLCSDEVDQDCNGVTDDGEGCYSCGRHEFGPHRYWLCTPKATYEVALAACDEQLGAGPLMLASQAEQDRVRAAIGGGKSWLGLTDQQTEGTFQWWDGALPKWTAWNTGEPNDWGESGEDCTELLGNGLWNDLSCGGERRFVCEALCEEGEDADGDGFERCSDDCDDGDPDTYPGALDTCADGVDQDCNGVTDDGPTCPTVEEPPSEDPCEQFELLGVRWAWCDQGGGWGAGQKACLGQGGALAWFETREQLMAVRAHVTGRGHAGSFWTGWADIIFEGQFVSPDLAPMVIEAWNDGQPDDHNEAEDCVEVLNSGLLNDNHCGAGRRPVCRLDGSQALADGD